MCGPNPLPYTPETEADLNSFHTSQDCAYLGRQIFSEVVRGIKSLRTTSLANRFRKATRSAIILGRTTASGRVLLMLLDQRAPEVPITYQRYCRLSTSFVTLSTSQTGLISGCRNCMKSRKTISHVEHTNAWLVYLVYLKTRKSKHSITTDPASGSASWDVTII